MSHRTKKKAHSSEFKFKVAIEAIRGIKTSAELCAEYGVGILLVVFYHKRT